MCVHTGAHTHKRAHTQVEWTWAPADAHPHTKLQTKTHTWILRPLNRKQSITNLLCNDCTNDYFHTPNENSTRVSITK